MLDSLCAIAGRSTRIPCPRPLSYTPSRLGFTADLPHLRLTIIVREMQNIVVSGAGVDSAGFGQEPWVFWQIQSQAADVSIPDPSGETPYNALPAPPPGDTWDVPHANGLYQGIIEHGCVGAPGATFDVTLDSWVARLTDNVSMGSVHLTDDVQGHGYYTFSYTLRATDDAGNVSDFVISGDANAFCVGKPHFDS